MIQKMKNLLLILGVLSLQYSLGEMTESMVTSQLKQCCKEFHVPLDFVVGYLHNDDWTVSENAPLLNMLTVCWHKKMDLLKSDNTLDFEKYKHFLTGDFIKKCGINNSEESVTKAIDNCRSIEGNSKENTFIKFYNCAIHFLTHHA